MKKHKKGGHHIGPIPHGSHRIGGLGKDPHAEAEHHAANAKMGGPEGCSPRETGDVGGYQEGGEGMAGNCEYGE